MYKQKSFSKNVGYYLFLQHIHIFKYTTTQISIIKQLGINNSNK